MTSNSGRVGNCERCGCANDNHTFGICKGGDGKGSKYVACTFEWSRCTTGGHNHVAEVKYVDCKRCRKHPGAPPSNGEFWGTQPDDEFPIYTADELGISWSESEDKSQVSKGKTKEAGHNRVDSESSEDPLQWSDERYKKETAGLVEDFGKSTINDKTASAWSGWSWTGEKWARYRMDSKGEYEYGYQEDSGKWSEWTCDPQRRQNYSSTRDPDGVQYYLYDNAPQESSSTATKSTPHKGSKGKGKGRK